MSGHVPIRQRFPINSLELAPETLENREIVLQVQKGYLRYLAREARFTFPDLTRHGKHGDHLWYTLAPGTAKHREFGSLLVD